MASLTANEDAVRAMPVLASLLERKGRPGLEGASARINIDIVRQINLAVAREHDLGTDSDVVELALARALAVAIYGLLYGREDRVVDPSGFLALLCRLTLETDAAFARGEVEFTYAAAPPEPGRA